jgi:23S rRNA (cytosine1962-C5)-methyltransferase
MFKLLSPQNFTDYELIDCGGFEKLERFGQYVIARPEPQAIWDKQLSDEQWRKLAHATFKRDQIGKRDSFESGEKGEWGLKPEMPQQWLVKYQYKTLAIKFRLGLTAFKHVGVFPEQAENWNYIFDIVQQLESSEKKVLNLFAYTGGASIAACAAGAEVTHVDSVKQVINWSRENMENSGLDNIRWIVDDALKFVQRETRRGNKYNGIILDPPAYGRGPDGEKWILEKSINELLKLCNQLLMETNAFVVLNLYSMGFSSLVAESLLSSVFGNSLNIECGELYLADKINRKLPLGVYARFRK